MVDVCVIAILCFCMVDVCVFAILCFCMVDVCVFAILCFCMVDLVCVFASCVFVWLIHVCLQCVVQLENLVFFMQLVIPSSDAVSTPFVSL